MVEGPRARMQEEYNLGISNFASNRWYRAAFVALHSWLERASVALKSSCPYASGFNYKVLLAKKHRIIFGRVLVVLETTGSDWLGSFTTILITRTLFYILTADFLRSTLFIQDTSRRQGTKPQTLETRILLNTKYPIYPIVTHTAR
jgi:hypothetical protein